VATVPTLADLTRAALNALDDAEGGFYLHVEGGAVDWAMHDNQMGRMIEEMIDFKRALEVVVEWVEGHGGWTQTLVIVTADHDHLLWGPRSHVVPFDPLQDAGAGRVPGYRWLHDGHTNALVPLFVRGPGADEAPGRSVGVDPRRGPYLAQTAIHEIARAAMGP
jgi:alkaline phosphatase